MMKKLLKAGLVVVFSVIFAFSSVGMPVNASSDGEAGANIVGGTNATEQYGAASLWYPDSQGVNRHRCTASVIGRYWAVTAGHCLPILIPGQTQVRASSLNNTTGFEEVGLAAVYRHPDFYSPPSPPEGPGGPNLNDIALLRFQRPVTKSSPLPMSATSPAIGTIGKIAGWGCAADATVPRVCDQPFPVLLQELNVKVISDSKCATIVSQDEFCGIAANGANAMGCYGDSGSPFVRKVFGKWILTGITIGDADAHSNHPQPCGTNPEGGQGTGHFIDISRYVKWIRDTIIANGGAL